MVWEGGVKKVIYIRLNQPTLIKDRGRYKLLNAYDPVLTSLPKVSNTRELDHSADKSCSESNWNSRYAFYVLHVVIKIKSI